MTPVELTNFIECLVVLEHLMAEELAKEIPISPQWDYLRGTVEGKRDAYRNVLRILTGEPPTKKTRQ